MPRNDGDRFELDSQPLEEAAQRAAELFVRFHRGLAARPVAPSAGRRDLRERFAGSLAGDGGVGLLALLEELERDVLPAAMTTPHPLYLGLVNSSPFPAGVLADLVVSMLDNNAGAFHQSPAATAIEEEVVRAFAALFGVGGGARGMLLPGGTFANLQGILLARARRFPEWSEEGPTALPGRPVLLTSEAVHFACLRSARAAGLGRSGVVALPTRGRGTLDPEALAAETASRRAAGEAPFAVIATAGTTGTGAIDPLEEIAEICREEGLWLHVDACYGGAVALLDELRGRLRGIERADSIAVDPHKWFFVPMTAGLFLTRHPEVELAAFDVAASYVPAERRPDAYRRGVPTSRRASAVTVWAALRAHGWAAVREAVRRNVALTRRLEARLAGAGFRVLPDGELSVACARWEPRGVPAKRLDALQEAIARDVVASGRAWFSTVLHGGRRWLRFNLVNLHTREEHVDALAGWVGEAAERAAESRTEGAEAAR